MTGFMTQPSPTRRPSVLDTPATGQDVAAVISELARRLAESEKRLELAVDEQALARILLTDRDILIQGDRVSILGQLNIADWVRDVSGNPTGGVDPSSMTRIVGGKIQTGVIYSANWGTSAGSAINLDAGTITMGGSSSPKFSVSAAGVMTCVDAVVTGSLQAGSVIAGTVTVGGVTLSAISSNASLGSSAYYGLLGKIDKNASYVLGAASEFKTSGYDGGNGMIFTNNGILAKKAGVNTFVIASDGSATFSGALSAATGSFAGNVDGGGYIKATGGVAGWWGTAAVLGLVTGTALGVVGDSQSGIGVYGRATTGFGVEGEASGSGGFGVRALASGSATALGVSGPMTISSSTLVTNLNADYLDGYHASVLCRATSGATTGSDTATFAGTNKPGGSSSNVWLPISVNGSTYYLPVWS